MLPLARDQHGNPFDVPPEAAFWRVRRQTGGRPSAVLGPDGEPLFIPIGGDRLDLSTQGCTGSLRLEAVDGDYHPVDAPVAYVEIAASDKPAVRNAAGSEQTDLVRTSFESMTRTMEAMQRAQVERERALAQKERALTDAQVAMQRNHVELMVALLDRATGGKPQDPLAVVEQHMKLQKVIDRQGPRNAGLLAPSASDDDHQGGKAHWLTSVLPFTPVVAQMFAKMLGSSDKKAAEMARNAGTIANAVGALQNGDATAVQTITQGMVGGIAAAVQPDAPAQPEAAPLQVVEGERWIRPRAIREVLAQLDDDASDAFDDYLDALDEDSFDLVCDTGASIANLTERVAWARGLLQSGTGEADVSEAAAATPEPPAQALPDVPPALYPVLAQLTPEEQAIGAQLLVLLDRATVDNFTAQLAAVSPDQALKMIRHAIAEAQRRSPSVAHRAVRAAMSSVESSSDGAAS